MTLTRCLAALGAALVLSLPAHTLARDDDPPPLHEAITAFVRARDEALARVGEEPGAALAALDAAAATLRRSIDLAPEEPDGERGRLLLADADLVAGRRSSDLPRVERALAAYDAHCDQQPAGPALLFHAYAQRVEALLALGRADEAAARAEELTWVERPWDPADAAERAALDALVLETYLRAVTLHARALLALDRPADALRAASAVDARPTSRGWREHALAPTLEVERARALHALGRGAEAAAALEALAAAGRAAAARGQRDDLVAGLGTTRAGALACRALADLDLAGGLPLDDAATAHDAGLGHLLAGRPEHALVAWKRVLAVTRTPGPWAPAAAARAGRQLLAQERWLEAALTFEAALVLAPEAASGEVARLALLAATRATRQLGEELTSDGPAARLRRRVEAVVARSPAGAEVEATARLEAAVELERARRWADAARAYEAVPASSAERPRALVRAGACLLRLGRADALARARALLEEARTSAGAEAARAACVLAEVELADDRPEAALAALDGDEPPDDLRVRAARARATAFLALDEPGAVERALTAFEAVADRADDAHHAAFAVELAAELRRRAGALLGASTLGPDDARAARALLEQAAGVVAAWAAGPGAADALSPEQALWAARALLEGQRPDAAIAPFERALATPSLAEEPAARLRARAERGLALLDRSPREAWDALVAVRDAVVVRDRRGGAVLTGTLVERRLAGPFAARREGRVVQEYAHVTTLRDEDGVTRTFVDVAPAEGEARLHVVEGERPPPGRVPGDERTLTLEGRRLPLVVLGLERAARARWDQERDRRFLATEALAASAGARALLRARDEEAWRRLAVALPGEPLELSLRRWDADLGALELNLALERWSQVASDLRMLELLGRDDVPAALRPRHEAIRAAVAARR